MGNQGIQPRARPFHSRQNRKKTKHSLLTVPAFLSLSLCLTALWTGGWTDPKPRDSSLTVIIPGIQDAAYTEWTGFASGVSPPGQRYVITYDDGSTKRSIRRFGKYFESSQPLFDSDHLIRVNPKDPKSQAFLQKKLAEIAKQPNASVVVDMDIGYELKHVGVRLRSDPWKEQTLWAGNIAAKLAEQHMAQHPDSKTTLVGHSAGCEAMLATHAVELVSKKTLFNQRPIALSPRNPDAHPNSTFVVMADGDFIASPGGVPSWNTTRSAEVLAARGMLVARITDEDGSSACSWPNISNLLSIPKALQSHTAVTELWAPDQKILLYAPGSSKPEILESTSLQKAITNVREAESAGTPIDAARLSEMTVKMRAQEPTRDIGGISLCALVDVPIEPDSVRRVEYDPDARRLRMLMINGRRIALPEMDPEVLRLAYRAAYLDGVKPELSIGSAPEGVIPIDAARPGHMPVYYLGNSDGTLLGLVMLEADQALATLAFGSTKDVRSVADRVPGFRTLPELYPQRYSDNPGQQRFAGADSIFLHPTTARMVWADRGQELRFSEIGFNIRFNRAGPAEDAFAAYFVNHFQAIAATDIGKPIGRLVPYAQAIALLTWFRQNGVSVSHSTMEDLPISRVYTPREVAFPPPPSVLEITPRAPTVFYGPHGPERIVRTDGSETRIAYQNGLPIDVHRHDGVVLNVLRDGMGNPVRLRIGESQAVFYRHEELGMVFAEGVTINESDGTASVTISDKTTVYPDNQLESTTRLILARFAFEKE